MSEPGTNKVHWKTKGLMTGPVSTCFLKSYICICSRNVKSKCLILASRLQFHRLDIKNKTNKNKQSYSSIIKAAGKQICKGSLYRHGGETAFTRPSDIYSCLVSCSVTLLLSLTFITFSHRLHAVDCSSAVINADVWHGAAMCSCGDRRLGQEFQRYLSVFK